MLRSKRIGMLLGMLAIGLAAFAEGDLQQVRLVLNWHAQSQFAGFYLAKSAGYYAAEGLDVSLIHVAPEQNTGDFISSGEADFAIDWLMNAMIFASRGVDIVQVVQLERRSGLLLVARRRIERDGREIEVHSLSDLKGARIGLWLAGSYWKTLQLLLDAQGVTDYTPVEVLKNVDLFLYGGVDAISAMDYNEYFQILCAGIDPDELSVFNLDGSDVMCGEGLYATGAMASEHPEVCLKLARASFRGWELARRNPERALREVRLQCTLGLVPFSEAHQRWMLDHCLKLIFPDGGTQTPVSVSPGGYDATCDLIEKMGIRLSGTALEYRTFCPFAEGEEK